MRDGPSGQSKGAVALSLFEKIWNQHAILTTEDGETLLYVDRHLIHEGSANPFRKLAAMGAGVSRHRQTIGTADHYVPTSTTDRNAIGNAEIRDMIDQFDSNLAQHRIEGFTLGSPSQGIVHVIGPELGFTLPGCLLVCGDSHTSTHGALGAFAFGIGASEVAHVLATQTLWQRKPGTMRITLNGMRNVGVEAKDVILAIIGTIGTGGASGHVIEYAGPIIESMSIEERLTVCNMSIEAGARAGLIAPDETTYSYVRGRRYAPEGAVLELAIAKWKSLRTDAGTMFDRELTIDGSQISPMITWGTNPEMVESVTGTVPDPSTISDTRQSRETAAALDYMGLAPGTRIEDITVDQVFIGSCTNSRIEDLRRAAEMVKGKKVVIPAIVTPGSGHVVQQAVREGLDAIFIEAGFEWRAPGCSFCVGMNGDLVGNGKRCVSTSNRNFVGRQGVGARTHLASPSTAAAVALTGRVTDPRQCMAGQ